MSGRNSSYPPVISAIIKIAVKGAYKIPAIKPAIPTSAKLLVEISTILKLFMNLENKYPKTDPKNKAGANIPPTPPALSVKAEAKALKSTIATRSRRMAYSVVK